MFWGCANTRTPRRAAIPELGHSHRNPMRRIGLIAALSCLLFTTPLSRADTLPSAAGPATCLDSATAETAVAHTNTRIVIIIDDLGHSLRRGMQALELPGAVTYAVIPFTAHGRQLANAAFDAGKEVMLHAPMSTLEKTPLDAGGLTSELSREEFNTALLAALENIPHVRGVNNHMGSDLTTRRQQMAWLMRELRWQDLYFVDSRTNKETVAATVAAEFKVPHLSRHVFLDNERSLEAIAERFEVLLAKARDEGLAVAIGHPYPETIEFLTTTLPVLSSQGVRLVSVSDALALNPETESVEEISVALSSPAACCPAC